MLQLLDIILSATGFGIRATIFPFSRDKLDELGAEWKKQCKLCGWFVQERKKSDVFGCDRSFPAPLAVNGKKLVFFRLGTKPAS